MPQNQVNIPNADANGLGRLRQTKGSYGSDHLASEQHGYELKIKLDYTLR